MVNQKLYIINLSNFYDIISELKEHIDYELLKFDNKEGYLGDYLGIPTIEIESIKSMINNPEQKRKTWNSLKLIIQLMQNENKK